MLKDLDQLLRLAAYSQEEMNVLFDEKRMYFSCLDPVLGYLPGNGIGKNDGINDSSSEYIYESGGEGERQMVNYADKPCRINTYGNSYTQCVQVNGGETWQEILAAHFREPIRNFGVGGHGVYQAYRRAMRVEETEKSAEYMILNLWDDDHLRSIDNGRWPRVAWIIRDLPRSGPNAYGAHGFPWAHVRYNIDKGFFEERDALCQSPEELKKLVGQAYYDAYKDDEVVHLFALTVGGDAPINKLEALAESFSMKVNLRDKKTRIADADRLHKAYGIRASQFIVDKWQKWAQQRNKKLMVLLSYDVPTVIKYLEKGERFDQEMVAYLRENNFTYVDFLEKAAEEYKIYKLSPQEFVDRFYVERKSEHVFGHYNPYGNHWFAHVLRPELLKWLNPAPPTYLDA